MVIRFLILFLLSAFTLQAQVEFSKFFADSSLRIDYILMVNSDTTLASLQQLKQETPWPGTRSALIDPFGYGNYRYQVYDSASGSLIYSNGYSSLSAEWRFMEDNNGKFKSFYESVSIPYPKNTVRFVLKYRDKHLKLHKILDFYINPDNIYISHEKSTAYPVEDLMVNGDYKDKVDLVILPEGYTQDQMDVFLEDARRIMNVLFEYEPFVEHRQDFNVRAVLCPSQQNGTDNPGTGEWKNTLLNSHFYTFGTPRYLTTEDYKTIKDVASNVPYDQIIILVNTATYGGGGFYNFMNLTAARNPKADPVFVHEFGHAFAGLADEYVDNSLTRFYDQSLEPWEPNITTLVDFASKWQDLVPDTVPVPTPAVPEYENVVGAFEGAGYSPTGIYRPQQKCLMRQLDAPFCAVCRRTILSIINYYTQ